MKKLLSAFFVLLIMSGCDVNTKSLSCSNTSTANGITTKTTYDIDYKDDDVKKIKITYDYIQDNDVTTDNTTTDDMDGTNADTDGLDTDDNKDADVSSDDVVDGVVGDAIDSAIDGVTDTILDLAGIRDTYSNQISTYGDIKGFSYEVDTDTDDEYKVIYTIDMDKISDDDLSRVNIATRDFSDLKDSYQDMGYSCK